MAFALPLQAGRIPRFGALPERFPARTGLLLAAGCRSPEYFARWRPARAPTGEQGGSLRHAPALRTPPCRRSRSPGAVRAQSPDTAKKAGERPPRGTGAGREPPRGERPHVPQARQASEPRDAVPRLGMRKAGHGPVPAGDERYRANLEPPDGGAAAGAPASTVVLRCRRALARARLEDLPPAASLAPAPRAAHVTPPAPRTRTRPGAAAAPDASHRPWPWTAIARAQRHSAALCFQEAPSCRPGPARPRAS